MALKRIYRIYVLHQENYDSIYHQPYSLVQPTRNMYGRYATKEDAEKDILEYGSLFESYVVLETLEVLEKVAN